MKKIIATLLIVITFALGLCSCGMNVDMIDTEYEFNTAYINMEDGQMKVDVKKWSYDDSTFTVIAKDGKVYCSSKNNIILVKE